MAIVGAFSSPYPLITGGSIVRRALRLIGVYAAGENLSAEDAQDGLAGLNSLVGSLSNSKLLINAMTLDEHVLTSGVSTVTIGPSGDIVSVRPLTVDQCSYLEKDGISYPLKKIDATDYNAIGEKETQGDVPVYFWASADMPDMTIRFYPVPGSGYTLNLWSWKPLHGFPNLITQLALPPGYQEMLEFNLACTLAPEYERDPSSEVRRQAMLTMKRVKRTNTVVPRLGLPRAVLPNYYPGHIESDT